MVLRSDLIQRNTNYHSNMDRILPRYIVHYLRLADGSDYTGDMDMIPVSLLRARLIDRMAPLGMDGSVGARAGQIGHKFYGIDRGAVPVLLIQYSILAFTSQGRVIMDRFEHEFKSDAVYTDFRHIECETSNLFKSFLLSSVMRSATFPSMEKVLQFIA